MISKKEIIQLLQTARNRKVDQLADWQDVPNDIQGMKLREYARGQKNAIEDIITALEGNTVYLKILAGK